jgi:hypothetical protein
MFSVVALSFWIMVACGVIGIETSMAREIAFVVCAMAATIFFSSIDAWECEEKRAPTDAG